jgi:hypothetical protein
MCVLYQQLGIRGAWSFTRERWQMQFIASPLGRLILRVTSNGLLRGVTSNGLHGDGRLRRNGKFCSR